MKKFIAVLMMVGFLFGCSPIFKDDPEMDIALKKAVLAELVYQKPELKVTIHEATGRILDAKDSFTTVVDVQGMVDAEIANLDVTPASKEFIGLLARKTTEVYLKDISIGQTVLDSEQVAKALEYVQFFHDMTQ